MPVTMRTAVFQRMPCELFQSHEKYFIPLPTVIIHLVRKFHRWPPAFLTREATYYSITPSLSLFTDGIMTQPRCLFVGQALQVPHRHGGSQVVHRLVQALGDILSDTTAPRFVVDALIQI